jgi:hypothetical protein
MGRVVQSFAMGFVRGCLARAVVGVYVAVVFGACFLLPLARISRTPGADPKGISVPFGVGAFFLLVLPAVVAYFATRSRNARLDAVFEPLGLAGFPYALQFRRYEGAYGGRRLQALVSRGPRVVLEADTAVPTRFGITAGAEDTKLFAGLAGAQPIRFAVPAYDGLVVYGKEEAWVRRLLAEPGVPALLSRLLRFEGVFARRQLVLRPGALTLTFQLSTGFLSWIPSPAQARDWAEALVALSEVAEALPAPAVALAPTRLEQQVDSVRRMGLKVNPGAAALVAVFATPVLVALATGAVLLSQKVCRPSRGAGSNLEGARVVSNVVQVARSLQVAELKPIDVLGGFGIFDGEDAAALRAKAIEPRDARIVVAKDPGSGAGREVEWVFATPPAIRMSYVEEQLGRLEYSPAPDDPKAVVGVVTAKAVDGAKWTVRVRVTFEGKAGGPITRIAVSREAPLPVAAASTAAAAGPEPAPAVAGPAGSEPLSPCPTMFEDVGPMEVGASRSCVCVHGDLSGTIRGSGRYAPSSWICSAARHAGVLENAGDVVTFTRQPDCPRLWGSRANDKLSLNLGTLTATFSFASDPPPCPPPPSTAVDLAPCPASGSNGVDAMAEGSSFDCTCSYNGMVNGRLMKGSRGIAWGTNVYASFSNVCDAAQHAGAVDFRGSTVTVFVGGTCDRFFGSNRFGIGSESRGRAARVIAFQQPFPACPVGAW